MCSLRVLVIEDDIGTQDSLRTMLRIDAAEEQVNLDLAFVGTMAEAMNHENGFDLVLLDLKLPDSDTLETVARIGEISRRHHSPVIVITGYADSGWLAENCIDNGAAWFTSKGFALSTRFVLLHTFVLVRLLWVREHRKELQNV